MKLFHIISFLFLLFSCKPSDKRHSADDNIPKKELLKHSSDSLLCDTETWYKKRSDRDSVLVYANADEKAYYKKGELKRILKSYPELNRKEFISSPDETYAQRGMEAELKPCDEHLWGCEVCKDTYYIIYAHFLKQRNGEQENENERENLITIFRDINHIYMKLAGGGTYFAHQYKRIVAYAEYDVYLKRSDSKNGDHNKTYNIAKQKRLYLDGLKQFIVDEINNNMDIPSTEKLALKAELSTTIKHIDHLTTNYFCLRMAQQFEHANY